MGSTRKKSSKKVDVEMKDSAAPNSQIMDALELQRTRVVCGPDVNLYVRASWMNTRKCLIVVSHLCISLLQTSSSIAHNQYSGFDGSFSLEKFRESLKMKVRRYDGHDMEFEVEGISCSIANALRRVMIAEVPTMAIEHVYIVNNTSIIQDEVLSHRLGLIPLDADPRLFEWKGQYDESNEKNTIVMKLNVTCRRLPDGSLENEKVYSSQLEWLSAGSELPEDTKTMFESDQSLLLDSVNPVHDDILIAKLRPGQTIQLECHCVKGVGEEHAKWSPVATTWYKLYPEVALLQDSPSADMSNILCEELPGLFYIDKDVLCVDDAINHEKLLEKVRRMSGEDQFRGVIQLRKRKDKFIFIIESTGAWKPHEIFQEAIKRLESKCDKVLEGLASN
jgi:DNA-directed RNA polymerase I and III subunit RPAC1